eukprot:Rmarinus@m.5077
MLLHFLLLAIFSIDFVAAEEEGGLEGDESVSEEWELEEEEEAGDGIFDLGRDLDVVMASWLLLVLIAFTMGIEWFLETIEELLEHHPHYMEMVQKVYRELMILGFISFMLKVVESFLVLTEEESQAFEFSHNLLFFVALFFVLYSVYYMEGMRRIKIFWDDTQLLDANQVLQRYKDAQSESSGLRRLLRVWFVRNQMHWLVLRDLFFEKHNLPPEFDFAKYLRKSLTEDIIEMLEVGPASWFTVSIVISINCIRYHIESEHGSSVQGSNTLFILSGFLMLFYDAYMLYFFVEKKEEIVRKSTPEGLVAAVEQLAHRTRSKSDHNMPSAVHVMSRMVFEPATLDASAASAHTSATQTASGGHTQEKKGAHAKEGEGGHAHEKSHGNGGDSLAALTSYPRVVNLMMNSVRLFQCFWFALFVLVYVEEAFTYAAHSGWLVFVVMLIPLVLRLVINPFVIAHVSMLTAFTMARPEQLEAVAKRLMECYQVSKSLHTLEHDMKTLFQEYDADADGRLSIRELKAALATKGVTFTRREFERFMRFVDVDRSGYVDYERLLDGMLYFYRCQEDPEAVPRPPPSLRTTSHQSDTALSHGPEGQARPSSHLYETAADGVDPASSTQKPSAHETGVTVQAGVGVAAHEADVELEAIPQHTPTPSAEVSTLGNKPGPRSPLTPRSSLSSRRLSGDRRFGSAGESEASPVLSSEPSLRSRSLVRLSGRGAANANEPLAQDFGPEFVQLVKSVRSGQTENFADQLVDVIAIVDPELASNIADINNEHNLSQTKTIVLDGIAASID